jgi:hypothetical protein
MHDAVDFRRRIDRVVARVDRRDDYGELLVSNSSRSRAPSPGLRRTVSMRGAPVPITFVAIGLLLHGPVPEMHSLATRLEGHRVLLDGELVHFDVSRQALR